MAQRLVPGATGRAVLFSAGTGSAIRRLNNGGVQVSVKVGLAVKDPTSNLQVTWAAAGVTHLLQSAVAQAEVGRCVLALQA